jgi:hypothetical protein
MVREIMTEEQAANWRDLCNAALTARDPDRLLDIIEKLNATLEREERARRARLGRRPALSPNRENEAISGP